MTDIDVLTPDHSVKIGDDADRAGNGKQGRHTAVSVALTLNETHTFRSAVEVETSPIGDIVLVESVPDHIAPELLGVVVELDGDVIAEGVYGWTDTDPLQSGENARPAKFTQMVRCATCERDIGKDSTETAVGRVCRQCAYRIDNGVVEQ